MITYKIDTANFTALKVLTGDDEPIETTNKDGNTILTWPPKSGTHFDTSAGAVEALYTGITGQVKTADEILTELGITVTGG